jgi:integrase
MSDRSKGNGSIQQRAPGTWQMRYYGPPDESGRSKQHNETVKGSRREVERLLRERLTSIESGGFVAREKETVGQFLARWLNTYGASNVTLRTLQGYRQSIKNYSGPINHVQVQSLTARHVQGVYSGMAERGLSATTIVQFHRIIHKALATGVKWGTLARNVSDAATPPRIFRQEVAMWDVDTIHQFLEAAGASRYRDFYHLALLTGARRSELAGLQWPSVDLVIGRLAVVKTLQWITGKGLAEGQPKTDKSRRSIALSPEAVALLHEIRGRQIGQQVEVAEAWQNTGYVFTRADGRPVDPNDVSKDFSEVVKSSGLPPLTLHGLRHAHATLLLEAGINVKVVSERLGHASIAITLDIYSHVLPGIQEAAALALDAKLARK